LRIFDSPEATTSCTRRDRSNTPLQALVLLNDPTFVEAARALATRMLKDGGATAESRIDFAFRQAVGRPATPGEIAVLTALHKKHLAEYTTDQAQAAAALTNGDSKPPEGIDAAELAAWISVARAILNLHEVVTRS
jgi:hypothetical protein